MRKHTILHTIDTRGPGGAETVVLELASGLDTQLFRSLALVMPGSWVERKLTAAGVPTFPLEDGHWYDLRVPRSIVRVIRQEKVDLVHAHLPDLNFYGCVAGGWTGCRTVVTYHGPVELSDAGQMRAKLKLWWVRNRATAVVVVCDFVGGKLREIGIPGEKIVRIYNGIGPSRVANAEGGQLRKELGLRNGSKLVGMVANIRRTKGYEYFIRAAHRVLAERPEIHFVAIGDIDSELARPLWQLRQDLSLEDRFHFVGFREDVPQILNELDVFVLSSTAEGFPLVALEAMASGKPVVLTRCGGPEEVVDDGKTGYLVPPADGAALAARIKELLSSPERAAAMGARARKKVESELSLSSMIAQYQELYQRILGSV